MPTYEPGPGPRLPLDSDTIEAVYSDNITWNEATNAASAQFREATNTPFRQTDEVSTEHIPAFVQEFIGSLQRNRARAGYQPTIDASWSDEMILWCVKVVYAEPWMETQVYTYNNITGWMELQNDSTSNFMGATYQYTTQNTPGSDYANVELKKVVKIDVEPTKDVFGEMIARAFNKKKGRTTVSEEKQNEKAGK